MTNISKEHEFFIYLLERYAKHKNQSAQTVLKEWERLELTQTIFEMYELYHIERLQNAFDDIDKMTEEKIFRQPETQKTPF